MSCCFDFSSSNNLEIINTGVGIMHEIIMEDGKLKIYKDSYNEGPDLTKSGDFDFQSIEVSHDSNNQLTSLSTISYYYDSQAGANYTDQYVYHLVSSSGDQYYPNYCNHCYKDFNPYGGDCTNYVSQCLYTGGQPRVFDDGTKKSMVLQK